MVRFLALIALCALAGCEDQASGGGVGVNAADGELA